ncbi:MAG: class I SAM-dependent methyltransferase [Bacteroidetes bacterium]|nr:class I SAM-dependent methyltransferase [Bacteroidota bacterium]
MQKLDACPVCNSNGFENYLNCKDHTVSHSSFSILTCKTCTFKFTNPRPDSNEIVKYYESIDYISHSNTSTGLFNKIYQAIRNYTISQKYSMVSNYVSRGTLLDIGCGTGEFLNHFSKRGWNVCGVEPSSSARKMAITNYNLNVLDEDKIAQLKDESFNVISMWHVLEHVHLLSDRLKQINRIISKDGLLVIAVPNYTSYDAKHYREKWAAYDLPRHLYHFSPKTMNQLLTQNGFQLVKTLPMKFDSFYVSMLSEKYKNGKINYIKACLIGFVSNLKAGLKKDNSYSSQIYLFKKSN